jgi:hypothetical protein
MGNNVVDFLKMSHMEPMDPAEARRATRLAVSFNIAFLVVAYSARVFHPVWEGVDLHRGRFYGLVCYELHVGAL